MIHGSKYSTSSWIDLFKLIYCHNHLRDYFGELKETNYDISISFFPSYFHKLSRIAYEISLYVNSLTLFYLLLLK
jgi:hypothetical protein